LDDDCLVVYRVVYMSTQMLTTLIHRFSLSSRSTIYCTLKPQASCSRRCRARHSTPGYTIVRTLGLQLV
jgi:hypothetical protein